MKMIEWDKLDVDKVKKKSVKEKEELKKMVELYLNEYVSEGDVIRLRYDTGFKRAEEDELEYTPEEVLKRLLYSRRVGIIIPKKSTVIELMLEGNKVYGKVSKSDGYEEKRFA